jgi:hypothetical protein
LIVDRRAEKNDVVFQQSRVDIKRAFTTRRLLDDHWYESHVLIKPLLLSEKKDEGGRMRAEKVRN